MRAALRGAADRTAWRWSRRAKRRAVDGAVWSGDCGIRMVVRRDYMSRGLQIPMHTLLDCFFYFFGLHALLGGLFPVHLVHF